MQDKEPMRITTVHLPKRLDLLLKRAARGRQHKQGGRASVSALVSALLERHADELEVLADTSK